MKCALSYDFDTRSISNTILPDGSADSACSRTVPGCSRRAARSARMATSGLITVNVVLKGRHGDEDRHDGDDDHGGDDHGDHHGGDDDGG